MSERPARYTVDASVTAGQVADAIIETLHDPDAAPIERTPFVEIGSVDDAIRVMTDLRRFFDDRTPPLFAVTIGGKRLPPGVVLSFVANALIEAHDDDRDEATSEDAPPA